MLSCSDELEEGMALGLEVESRQVDGISRYFADEISSSTVSHLEITINVPTSTLC